MSFFSCIFAVENKINMGDENIIFKVKMVYPKLGYKVEITYPVKKSYIIKTKNKILAVCKAFNMARHDFSNIDWSMGKFKTFPYMYSDLS